jgi:hypothetical protein
MQQTPLPPYGNRFNPVFEGSGGGNRYSGGPGGGVIYFEIVKTLILNGGISSNGRKPYVEY